MSKGKMHTTTKSNQVPGHYGKTSVQIHVPSHRSLAPEKHPAVQQYAQRKIIPSHPNPLDLMEWLILTYTNRFDTILDPFAGSGSILIAAATHGRKASGIEQNYCDIFVQRLDSNMNKEKDNSASTSIDPILRVFSFVANKEQLPLPVTLTVKGLIISGNLVSYERYLELLREQVAGYSDSYSSDDLKGHINLIFESVLGIPVDQTSHSEAFKVETIRYVHLSDAKIYSTDGSSIPTGSGFTWRGSLTAIDGFSFGTLETIPRNGI